MFWPEGASGHPGTEWKVGRLLTFLPEEGGFLLPMLPSSGPCPHSTSCTVPITGVQTLTPFGGAKLPRCQSGCGLVQGYFSVVSTARTGSRQNPPEEKVSPESPLSLLVLWLPTLLASCFFTERTGASRSSSVTCPQITQRERK